MIRITGGTLRGRRLRVPDGIRPTAELVRKALFDILGDRVAGTRFLEVAAGSGAVGIEAISRGAESAVFVEKNRRVREVLLSNVESLGLGRVCRVVAADVEEGPLHLPGEGAFDIVFLDLPYEMDSVPVMRDLARWVSPGSGRLIVETGEDLQVGPEGLDVCDRRRYGATVLTFLVPAGSA